MNNIVNLNSQQQKLKEIYPYICSSPFYQKKLSAEFINPGFDPISNLLSIPFTSKDDLRLTDPMERTPLPISDVSAFFSSSGTTGLPSVYAWSKQDQEVYEAISSRILKNIRVNSDDVTLLPMRMGMSLSWYGIFTEMQKVGAAVILLGTSSTEDIIEALDKYPVTILKTSPVVASKVIREICTKYPSLLKKLKLRQIHLAGQYSSNARRRRLEKLWGVDVFDMYGLSEFGLVGGECEEKNGQHYCADFALLEVIRPDEFVPVSPGEAGVAVYTTLWKKASPLLRYWSEDFVYTDESPCSCGLNLPRLFFKGRLIDSAVIKGKRIFLSDVENVLFQHDEIGDEYQVELFGDVSSCQIKVQIEVVNTLSKEMIQEELAELLGAPVDLELAPLNSLVRSNPKPNRITDYRT